MALFVTRDQIVLTARSWLKTPYKHQQAVKSAGCDCLGLIRGVFKDLYGYEPTKDIPPYTPNWAEATKSETLAEAGKRYLVEIPPKEAAIGDVILITMVRNGPAKHAAIIASQNTMIHAYSGAGVIETSFYPNNKTNRIRFAFQFPRLL